MLNSVAANVGMRYAFARQSSISTIGFIAICGLALSVAVLVIVVSVVNGFERELRERVFGVLPHLSLYGREPLRLSIGDLDALVGLPAVASATAVVQGAGLAASGDKVRGVLLTGIDPDQYRSVSDLDRYLVAYPTRLRIGRADGTQFETEARLRFRRIKDLGQGGP